MTDSLPPKHIHYNALRSLTQLTFDCFYRREKSVSDCLLNTLLKILRIE
jgi:hypothetical protein